MTVNMKAFKVMDADLPEIGRLPPGARSAGVFVGEDWGAR